MAKPGAKPPPSSSGSKKSKRLKSLLSAPSATSKKKSSNPEPRDNPFETIWSRRKFDTLGRRRKGEERRVGLARSQAIEKRKKTLQKEYEQSTKSSRFLDNRIGEKDETLQESDKAVLRLQREWLQRQRQLNLQRSSKYNLPDGEEDEFEIHDARSLSEMDDFKEEVPADDEDEEITGIRNDSESSKFLNLHGGHDLPENSLPNAEENNQKTKKQVMQEIILKSKHYKAQKVKDKEEDDHLMQKLDKDFASLAQSEALLSLTQPGKMNALKALLNKNVTRQPIKGHSTEGPSGSADKESFKEDKPDPYDKLVKAMALDIRARPSYRTKTPEEIAQEERERLESLEEERKKRMLATDDSSDEGSGSDEDSHKQDAKNFKSLSGDDLGDSFTIEEGKPNKRGWVDDIYEKEDIESENPDEDDTSSKNSESEEEEAEEEEEEEEEDDDENDNDDNETSGNKYGKLSMKDWEQSDDDDVSTHVEVADDPDLNNITSMDIKKKGTPDSHQDTARKLPLMTQEALPFVIEAPSNLSELCLLLDNRSDSEVVEAINRIRACNSIRLAAENRKKMQVFYGVLLQYFATLTSRGPLNIKLMNSIIKPLIEMSAETPFFAAICARQRLVHIRTRLCEDIKTPEKSSWPSLKTLLLLRLWSLIFPCSDFRHVVMTPAILLMCEYLIRCPILSGRDIAVGTFLCSMVLFVTKQSRKFCPETITFLHTLLLSAVEPEAGLLKISQCSHLLELKTLKPWLHIHNQVYDVQPIDFFMVMDMPVESPFFVSDNFKTSILLSVVETLKGFINLYEGLSSFPEIFLPFSALLSGVLQNSKLPGLLQGKIEDVIYLIKRKADENQMLRQPLQMRKQKPMPIKLLNPKFEENFVKGRDYDPDRERAERKKIKKQIKSEYKGAIREIRKDNHFIYNLKEKDRLQQEGEKAEQYRKTMAFLQEQEHAYKSGQLGKGRKRKK